LNIGIVSVGTGLIHTSLLISGFLFALGSIAAVLACFANYVQHGYYRTARNGKQRIEERLQLGERAIQTTPGMRGLPPRLGSVTSVTYALLAILAMADATGLGYVVWRA
jgi:hypothetical protein